MAVEPQLEDVLISKPHTHAGAHTSSGNVEIVPVSRVMEMYSLSEQELDQIGRASSSAMSTT
jgi:hypothetical protein